MVYHSHQDTANSVLLCGLPVLLVKPTSGQLQAADSRDIVDETLYTFRANILFRNFEVKGPADKLLIYLTLFVCQCLKRTYSQHPHAAQSVTQLQEQTSHRPSVISLILGVSRHSRVKSKQGRGIHSDVSAGS